MMLRTSNRVTKPAMATISASATKMARTVSCRDVSSSNCSTLQRPKDCQMLHRMLFDRDFPPQRDTCMKYEGIDTAGGVGVSALVAVPLRGRKNCVRGGSTANLHILLRVKGAIERKASKEVYRLA